MVLCTFLCKSENNKTLKLEGIVCRCPHSANVFKHHFFSFFLRRVHHSSVCSPPKSTCSSWSCMGGTSWTRESEIRAASRRTSTPLAQFLKRSCASITPLRWDASPSAWYPALPSAPRPSLWCPSKTACSPARFKHC